ncbi:MAG: hypothetical protein KAS04_01130 [Candidatus Aenigmarchaeota archaeon]|nr:hypothetical protein [Candidatus Aenigmarchaeota archaeon]
MRKKKDSGKVRNVLKYMGNLLKTEFVPRELKSKINYEGCEIYNGGFRFAMKLGAVVGFGAFGADVVGHDASVVEIAFPVIGGIADAFGAVEDDLPYATWPVELTYLTGKGLFKMGKSVYKDTKSWRDNYINKSAGLPF